MFKYIFTTIIALTFALCLSIGAFAATNNYQLFGDATLTSPGHNSPTAAQLTSQGTSFSGIDFTADDSTTFSDLDTLSADYFFTEGSCFGGSPRFQINVIDPNTGQTKNIFVYFGDYPNYTNCAQNTWVNTGDLLASGLYVDTSQIGGTFYDTYENAVSQFGNYEVTGVQLVVDGGWMAAQSVLVDNVVVDNMTYTFENKETCKNGGFKLYTSSPGPFRNQGQCVSHYARLQGDDDDDQD